MLIVSNHQEIIEIKLFAHGKTHFCTSSKSGTATTICYAGNKENSDLISVSPNGTFIFELRHRKDLDMNSFHGLKISIGGTYSSFN